MSDAEAHQFGILFLCMVAFMILYPTVLYVYDMLTCKTTVCSKLGWHSYKAVNGIKICKKCNVPQPRVKTTDEHQNHF